jgi:hypothetical protein
VNGRLKTGVRGKTPAPRCRVTGVLFSERQCFEAFGDAFFRTK